MRLLNRKKKIDILSPLEGYNLWAASYKEESNPIKNLSDELVHKFLPDLQNKMILDFGCGTGKFCEWAQKQNAAYVMGVDLSPSMIEVARKACPEAEFLCGSITELNIEKQKYDVAICALVLAHLEEIVPTLTIIVNSLKANGVLIITDFHPFLTLLGSKELLRIRKQILILRSGIFSIFLKSI